jgi:hypothetical protein
MFKFWLYKEMLIDGNYTPVFVIGGILISLWLIYFAGVNLSKHWNDQAYGPKR